MSTLTVNVRVLVSFYASREDGSVSSEALHKEKFCVPVDEGHHKDLNAFKSHLIAFTDIKSIAAQKGIGKSFDMTISRVSVNDKGGVDVFSIRTQDSWIHEWPEIMSGNGKLQVSICQKVTAWVSGPVLLVQEAGTSATSTSSEAQKETKRNIRLTDIPKMRQLPSKHMCDKDQIRMRQWAKDHGRAVRQRTVRQNNTMHAAGTLPLHMYQKELPVGEAIQFKDLDLEEANESQVSEYDSDSIQEELEHEPTQGDDLSDVDVNFLAKTIRTQSGRVIGLSMRALESYTS